jgi:hypothetical protein
MPYDPFCKGISTIWRLVRFSSAAKASRFRRTGRPLPREEFSSDFTENYMSAPQKATEATELEQRLTKQIKILEIEKSVAGRLGFWKGLLTGFLSVFLAFVVAVFIIWQNKERAVEFVAGHFFMDYAENLFSGFPDGYMTHNRERVILVLDEFTNAMAAQRVSKDDFRAIFYELMGDLRDQRLTYQELEALLQHFERAARGSE